MIAQLTRAVCLTLALVVALAAGPGRAGDAPDYKAWEKQAAAVQEAVGEAKIPDEKLSDLRAELVKWRNTFTEAQGTNADQIATVKGQIAALGPAPAEGTSEDPAIAKRRAELSETLSKLQAPDLAASEASSRADGLIRTIDKIVRERQADKLLRLSPSPLNPINWTAGASLIRWMGAWIYDETIWRFTRPINWETLRNNAPLIAVLLLTAGVLLLRGSRWLSGVAGWAVKKTAMRGYRLILGIVSLGEILLPVIGAVMLTTAAINTAFFGPILTQLIEMAPGLFFVILLSWWIGRRIFPAQVEGRAGFGLSDQARAEGRFHALLMGVAVALQKLLTEWITPRAQDFLGGSDTLAADKAAEVAARADAAIAVLAAPLLVFAALMLFRMGQLLRRGATHGGATDQDTAFRDSLMRWLGSAAIAVAVVAPALGAIGYVSAADALLWPAIVTLGVLGLVTILQGFIAEFYIVITRSDESRREALVPVLAGFVLTLAALPVLALVWGARPEDLLELWTRFRAGFSMGGVQISPAVFLTFAVIFAAGYTATRLMQAALKNSILPKTTIDKGGQNAIVSGVGYVGLFAAAVLAISAAGIDLSSLAIVAGALSVGIGFGLQNIVQNFVSGIILLIERPISEGDWIEVGGQQGVVRAISVRSTIIETFDRTDVIVPNADLVSGQVTNWTRGNKMGRLILPVGVAYGSDTRRVEQILLEIAQGHPLVMLSPEPFVLFTTFGADSLNFEIRAILSDVNFKARVLSDMNHTIAARFAAEGIEIPFAQRDIWLRNPEALGRARPNAASPSAPHPPAAPPEPPAHAGQPLTPEERLLLSDNDGAEDGDAR